jgi:RimJ/RimL family protein N-acetyltransferase
MIAETPRLHIRELTIDDAEFILGLVNEPSFLENIGVCGLLFREALDVSDIGCAFLPLYWRRGYAYEAACAVIEYGRSTLGIEKIVGLTSEKNIASIRALEKLGMSFEKIVKMSDDDPGTALFS